MSMTSTDASHDADLARFTHDRYMVRTKVFRFFGGAFHVYDDQGNVVLYFEQKRFKLKEDIRLYPDESMTSELLRISTQSIFDIAGAYDVQDSVSGERIGTLKREGISSTFLRDQWQVFDGEGNQVGQLQEDSMLKALVRRFVEAAAFLMPQKYHLTIGEQTVATYQQRFNPIIMKLDVDFSQDRAQQLDRRLGLAAAVLLSAIEGRQQ
jgi:uncharacterized protein YxjI